MKDLLLETLNEEESEYKSCKVIEEFNYRSEGPFGNSLYDDK